MTCKGMVVIKCNKEGCSNQMPTDSETCPEARSEAEDNGWDCAGDTDLCPDHKGDSND